MICPTIGLCDDLEDKSQKSSFDLQFSKGDGKLKEYDFCYWGLTPSTIYNKISLVTEGQFVRL